ncbi:hydantoinase B/oxoprolinase family protein [Myxococcota bacterium]|nr:hydantoinase B/oxoprolinase family protein [Myxococcota bacterium]
MSGPRPARRVWMDQGGTFTDVVQVDAGGLRIEKVLSDRASLAALAAGADEVRRGTTVATNALLERKGVPVLLLTSAGFGDAAALGDQVRPDLFALHIHRPPPLCAEVLEVEGRLGLPVGAGEGPAAARVEVLVPHAVDELALRRFVAAGLRAAAVVLVHGPQVPEEERRLAAACRAAGFSQVSLGHEVAPSRGFLARLHTTLADAALTPLLPTAPGAYMKSDGGLAAVDAAGRGPEWRGAWAVLSGPAGGVVACEALARAAELGPVLGLDMGGTSTDVCRVDGAPDRVDHVEIGGVRLRVPAVRVQTVAAGGGSVLRQVGGVWYAGPESAGAAPGPACYGRGGPATVTDCEAVRGRLPGFPAIAGPGRDQPLDLEAARRALGGLDPVPPVEVVADGAARVAVEQVARAVRALAAHLGVDPAAHTLVAFGGAGPGHACAVARALGIHRVVVPHLAGVFSAVGIGLARRRAERVAPVIDDLAGAVAAAERALAAGPGQVVERRLVLRHVDMADLFELALPPQGLSDLAGRGPRELPDELRTRFLALHLARFGFDRPGLAIEAVEARVSAEDPVGEVALPVAPPLPTLGTSHARAWFDGWREVPLRRPEHADGLLGPALIAGAGAAVVVPPGWRVRRAADHLALDDLGGPPAALSRAFHPVHTAVFASRVMAVAEQMGERLARLARSVSIRQRRDFSCAVFDADGALVANAPHVPVHLGAMGPAVRALLAERGAAVQPGTAWATNDPYAGGSHLPDITVIMPVAGPDGRRLCLVACRGHHVDVGGSTPGSMPPRARHIDEEGFLLRHHLLLDARGLHPPPVLALPVEAGGSRQPEDVRADLEAQVAACRFGVQALASLADEIGPPAFQSQLAHLQDHAEAAVRDLLPSLRGAWTRSFDLDAGAGPLHPVEVGFRCDGDRAVLHLRGDRHPGNLNAPLAIARAALLYTFRCLVQRAGGSGADLPLNDGALRPFEIQVEPGGLFDPRHPSAVAGGNVETSQRLVDALLDGLGALAGSQGTMNNLAVGTSAGAFYETIGGGAGAGPGVPGAHAVQVHMTNTRATDVEELEARFPVRLLRLARRAGSGGAGRWPGGDGVVKEWLFLGPARVSLLAGRRRIPAPGGDGGAAGAPGRDWIDRGQGWEPAPPEWQARPGDRLRIETPGGGGWGTPGAS